MKEVELPNGTVIEAPDTWSEARIMSFVRSKPDLIQLFDDSAIRAWGTDAKRNVTPEQQYWRIRGNQKAKPFETVWADEFKRRFGEPERLVSVKVLEWAVPVQAISYGVGGLGLVSLLLVVVLRMRRRLAGAMRDAWRRLMPWLRTDAPVRLLAAGMLLAAIGDRSYDYYTVLHWVTCVVCAYAGARAVREGQSGWAWALWALAAFYNPIFEVELRKDTWRWVNAATAATLVVSVWAARPRGAEGPGQDGWG